MVNWLHLYSVTTAHIYLHLLIFVFCFLFILFCRVFAFTPVNTVNFVCEKHFINKLYLLTLNQCTLIKCFFMSNQWTVAEASLYQKRHPPIRLLLWHFHMLHQYYILYIRYNILYIYLIWKCVNASWFFKVSSSLKHFYGPHVWGSPCKLVLPGQLYLSPPMWWQGPLKVHPYLVIISSQRRSRPPPPTHKTLCRLMSNYV